MCSVLGVSRAGYYAWATRTQRDPRGRAADDINLLVEIRAIHQQYAYYGSPRVHRELLARRHRVGLHRVARLMHANNIRAVRGKAKLRPRAAPPSRRPEITDQVSRDFTATEPNILWFTDVTQIRTTEGWVFAAVIIDAFNREVISWATAGAESPNTVLHALQDAVAIRRPQPGCIIHSDRGYQFTARSWLDLAAGNGLQVSIGERKSCYDNAAMESWFASFKNEALYPHGQPHTRDQARHTLFHYIWEYNNHRLHSTLGYRSPQDYAATESTCP